ncbi:beta strand repeat-containing protein [Halobacterium noricense]|uniref:beta strand repeat-containing protein n=1 Tax=Halobacterium noricense TaxID=223182 RepID=UPI001E58AAA4|nr:PKD domain-containing protein [Halobacterium noricense]UHH26553.1 PKD domain-containing protein [Halobacterium noricense]
MRVGGCLRKSAVILGVLSVITALAVGAGLQASTVAGASAQSGDTNSTVTFAYVNGENLTLVTKAGSEINLGVNANAIGAGKDVDGDGYVEIPYVTSNNHLKIVDKTGEMMTLTTDADKSKAKVAIGDHDEDGEDSVYYSTPDGVLKAANIVDNTTRILDGADTATKAVAGVGDVTGDGTPEVVYTDGSNIGYYNQSGVENSFYTNGVGSSDGHGIGAPRDLDGDGTARIPIVTGSNNVALVDGSGSPETLMQDGSAAKSPVAAVDWVNGSNLEVLFLNSSQNDEPYYVTLDKSTGPIDAVSGTADAEAGVAWVQDAPLVLSNFTLVNDSGTLQASFNSSSDLSSLDVTIDGPDSESLNLTDFTENTTDGRYTYTGDYRPGMDGNYTAILNSATATDGDTATPEYTDNATIDTRFNVTDLNATANGFAINISFNATDQLSGASVDIGGAENDTLDLNNFSTSSSDSPYVYTGTYNASTAGEYNVTLTQATSDDDQVDDENLTDSAIADEPLDVWNFTLTNETDGIHVAFNASEQLGGTTVDIDGPPNTTLNYGNFTENVAGDDYTYETTYETTEIGTYNGTLERAESTDGDVATPDLTANATLGDPFDVTNLTATARNGDLNLSFDTTHTLDAVTVEIAGAETDTLTVDAFSTNESAPTYTYTGRYEANTTGNYNVTLTDATATDDQIHDDTLTANATLEPLLTNATLTDTTDQNAIVNETDRVTITAEVSSAADSVTADASAFGAGSVALNAIDASTYEATIDVTVSNVTEQRRVHVTVSGVSGRVASDTTNEVVIDTEPPAVDVGENQTADAGSNVSFSPMHVAEPTTRIVDYEWVVAGAQRSGENVTTAFAEPGDYTVRLAVTDAAGNVGTDALTVTVESNKRTTESSTTSPIGGGSSGGGGSGGLLVPTATATDSQTTTPPTAPTTTTDANSGAPATKTAQESTTTPTNATTTPSQGRPTHNVEMPFGELFGIPVSLPILAFIAATVLAARRRDNQ